MIHAAIRLTGIESSFDPCNVYRDCPRGVTRGGHNVHIAVDNSLLRPIHFQLTTELYVIRLIEIT